MVVTPAIANLIRENKTYRIDSAIQTGRKFSMQLMDDHLWQLHQGGLIDEDELIEKCRRPDDMAEKIKESKSKLSGGGGGGSVTSKEVANEKPDRDPRERMQQLKKG